MILVTLHVLIVDKLKGVSQKWMQKAIRAFQRKLYISFHWKVPLTRCKDYLLKYHDFLLKLHQVNLYGQYILLTTLEDKSWKNMKRSPININNTTKTVWIRCGLACLLWSCSTTTVTARCWPWNMQVGLHQCKRCGGDDIWWLDKCRFIFTVAERKKKTPSLWKALVGKHKASLAHNAKIIQEFIKTKWRQDKKTSENYTPGQVRCWLESKRAFWVRASKPLLAQSSWKESFMKNNRTSLHRFVQDFYHPCLQGSGLSSKIDKQNMKY